jgi:hypothetical protein
MSSQHRAGLACAAPHAGTRALPPCSRSRVQADGALGPHLPAHTRPSLFTRQMPTFRLRTRQPSALAHTTGSFQAIRSRARAVPCVRPREPIKPLRARPHLYSPVSMTSGASSGSRTGVAVACPCCTRWGCRAALAPASASPARLVLQRQGGWYAAPAGRTCIVQSTPRRRNSGTLRMWQ